jgi:Na+-transporting NADH:ubiquinone oxidoreductase subunit A
MSKTIKIRRGKDVLLQGEAEKKIITSDPSKTYALRPGDFKRLVPKLELKEGAEVKAGTPLFHAKHDDRIKFCSPVSGELIEINRGARRVILNVKVLADSNISYEDFGQADPNTLDAEVIKEKLLASGCWPFITQRPFGILAEPDETPRDIFISGFDSVPLPNDYAFSLSTASEEFQTGINALSKLTNGKVYLGLKKGDKSFLSNAQGVEINYFEGPHPAGNVGVQIHHVAPINKGETVWTLNPADVVIIGRLFLSGKFDARRTLAICGSEVENPAYTEVIIGSSLSDLLKGRVKEGNNRIISGDVFTGAKVAEDDYLGFKSNTLTVIPEGDQAEFLGWLIPNYPRPSFSRTFPYFLNPKKKFKVNTSTHGEPRAFVVSGEYEKYLPMDVLPVQLLKAIMANDFEAMENLGIYEVVEEDVALCEFACTSKTNVQEIIRDGLDLMLDEG